MVKGAKKDIADTVKAYGEYVKTVHYLRQSGAPGAVVREAQKEADAVKRNLGRMRET